MSPGMRLTPLPTSRTGAAGSSLIELLVCVGIMGIITAGMYAFFTVTNQAYGEQAVVSRLLWTTNDALRRIAQDIRQAGTPFAFGPACASLFPAVVSASNAGGGSITIRVVLDEPARRTELGSDQLQTNPTFQVLSTTGYNVNDVAFLTDGVQCTRFVVTGVTTGANPGLQHIPANDTNTAGGAGATYPAATSMVYRLNLDQQIAYGIDTSQALTPWLTRNTGAGPRALVPDVEGLNFSYIMADGSSISDPATITTVAGAANIRRVNISVTTRADTRSQKLGGDGFRRETITSSVKLRNLGS
jgi:hypothetical protein